MGMFIWLVVACAMALIEVFTLTLVTVWFVVGGLAAFVAAFLGASLTVQIAVFAIVSIVCLVLFRPLVLKHRSIGEVNEASPVGAVGVVVERIPGGRETGRVETDDRMSWTALSADGNPLEVGDKVNVVGQESIKLIVERI